MSVGPEGSIRSVPAIGYTKSSVTVAGTNAGVGTASTTANVNDITVPPDAVLAPPAKPIDPSAAHDDSSIVEPAAAAASNDARLQDGDLHKHDNAAAAAAGTASTPPTISSPQPARTPANAPSGLSEVSDKAGKPSKLQRQPAAKNEIVLRNCDDVPTNFIFEGGLLTLTGRIDCPHPMVSVVWRRRTSNVVHNVLTSFSGQKT